jgi:hypothetical protein
MIHTERTKLLATALNNLGVGCILAGAIAPTVSGSFGSPAQVAFWIGLGVNLITAAQAWLGRL